MAAGNAHLPSSFDTASASASSLISRRNVFGAQNVNDAFARYLDGLADDVLRNRIVLVAADCFPSLHFLPSGLAQRRGFTLRTAPVPVREGESYVRDEDFIEAWTGDVALALVTWVSSLTSKRVSLAAMSEQACRRGSLAALDVTQGVGILPFDLTDMPFDFVCGSTLKWLCGAPGTGLGYIAPHALEAGATPAVRPVQSGRSVQLEHRRLHIRFRCAPLRHGYTVPTAFRRVATGNGMMRAQPAWQRAGAQPRTVSPTHRTLPRQRLSPALPRVLPATMQFFVTRLGFRLDAIFPADGPRTAIPRDGFKLRLGLDIRDGIRTLDVLCDDPAQMPAETRELIAPNGVIVRLVHANPPMTLPPTRQQLVLARANDDAHWSAGRGYALRF